MKKLAISPKDQTLICVVVSILLVFASYYYGYNRFVQMKEDTEREVQALKVRYDDLKEKYDHQEDYIRKTQEYDKEFEAILNKYDSGFSQKETLLFTTAMEEEVEVWYSSVGLQEANSIYRFGTVTSSNPINSGATVYSTDMVGYAKPTSYSYQCSYDNFKNMLDYILKQDSRYTINSVSASYNEEDDIVSGSFVFTKYAITGKDREYLDTDILDINLGTENLFVSETFNPDDFTNMTPTQKIINNFDFQLVLNPYEEGESSVVMSRRGVYSSQISESLNEQVPVHINVEGSKGEYTVRYKVGFNEYPNTYLDGGTVFNPGQSLDLVVYGSLRNGEEDLAGADVTIENNSDMELSITVVNDDEENPRFNLVETTGKIKQRK